MARRRLARNSAAVLGAATLLSGEIAFDETHNLPRVGDGVQEGGWLLAAQRDQGHVTPDQYWRAGHANDEQSIVTALATGKLVRLMDRDYYISTPLVLGDGSDATANNRLIGGGRFRSRLIQTSDNVPIVKFGGGFGRLSGISLEYANRQPLANTGAVGVELYTGRWCEISDIYVKNARDGFGIKQAGVYFGANWVMNFRAHMIFFQNWTGWAVDMRGYSGGSTGIDFTDIYTVSRDDLGVRQNVEGVYRFTNLTDMIGTNMNMEACNPAQGLYVEGGNTIFNNLHVEGIQWRGEYNGIASVAGGTMMLNMPFFASNVFTTADGITNAYLMRYGSGATLIVNGGSETLSAITGVTVRQFGPGGDGTNTLFTRAFVGAVVTNLGFFAAPYELRELDGQYLPLLRGINNDVGDADITVAVRTHQQTQILRTPLTVARAAALSTTNAADGDRFVFIRTAASTGEAWQIGTGPLATLPAGAGRAEVVYSSVSGWTLESST